MTRTRRTLAWAWRILVGGICCQYLVTAFLAVGWTYRYMQRTAVRQWFSRSRFAPGASFEPYAGSTAAVAPFQTLPRWVLGQPAFNPSEANGSRGAIARGARRMAGSLAANLRIGVQGILNTWVLTIIPAMLWAFGWYAGWDNSFNKGYEQAYVGPALSILGIALFLAVMLYVPMAQARQAVTGQWRSFYHGAAVWAVVRQKRLACLALAALYSLISIPVTLFKTAPLFLTEIHPATERMSAAQLLQYLNHYFFWAAIAGFAGYVFLRHMAARIYAAGVLRALAAGTLTLDRLAPFERAVLDELQLHPKGSRDGHSVPVEAARKAVTPPWRVTVTSATLLLWFVFVAQIYVSEFLNYHPVRGWMNQPLVQVPWFRYVPNHLQEAAQQPSATEDDTAQATAVHEPFLP